MEREWERKNRKDGRFFAQGIRKPRDRRNPIVTLCKHLSGNEIPTENDESIYSTMLYSKSSIELTCALRSVDAFLSPYYPSSSVCEICTKRVGDLDPLELAKGALLRRETLN